MEWKIRPETEDDYERTEFLVREAFWNLYVPGCDEHFLSHILRNHADFIKELDFVATMDDEIVGNIMYTRSWLSDGEGRTLETVTFGPVCVSPGLQRRGIGTSLIRKTLGLARSQKRSAVVILGHPANYCLHGFKSGKDLRIADSKGRFPCGLLALELDPGVLAGRDWKVRFSDAYDIDPAQVEEFDTRFAPRAKEYSHTQEVFSIISRAYLE